MLWAQLNRNVFSSGNRSRGKLFFKPSLLVNFLGRILCSSKSQKSKSPRKKKFSDFGKRSPLLCGFLLFIWEGETFLLPFRLSWWLCQSSLLLASSVSFFLLCCLVSGMGRLTSDFELISSVVMIETSYLSSSELRLLFTLLGLLMCFLFILAFG